MDKKTKVRRVYEPPFGRTLSNLIASGAPPYPIHPMETCNPQGHSLGQVVHLVMHLGNYQL